MLIQPDTTIRLLSGVPLDKSYEHTIHFNYIADQYNYFNSHAKHRLTKQSFQRYDKGVLHIQIPVEQLYDCNYIMFQNSAFDTKWFYSFITSVEYVSNVSSRVSYELDVMQTWMFDYELGECFVEREHTETDNIGDNLIPENVDTGEFIYSPVEYHNDSSRITPFSSFKVCALATFDKDGNEAKGQYHTSIYSGLYPHTFDTAKQFNTFLNTVTADQRIDGIVAVFMVPKEFTFGSPEGFITDGLADGVVTGLLEKIKKKYDNIDGHNVRNNKLFTMPYNSLLVTDHNGNGVTYGYEYFYDSEIGEEYGGYSNDYIGFEVVSSGANVPEYSLTPWFYKGLRINNLERMVIDSTPLCSYNKSVFGDWLAQNKTKIMVSTLSDAGQLLMNGYTSYNYGTDSLKIPFSNVLNNLATGYTMSGLPPTAKGNTGTGALNINTGTFGFSMYYCTIRKEYAEIIDSYFDMYGYAVNTLKKPKPNNRPSWNYIKTATCVLKGSIPANDAKAIVDIYNRGITFWNKDAIVGDYSQDNKPTK